MLSGPRKYNTNIIYCIGILTILSLIIFTYSGVKQGYFGIFLLACIVAPMILITRPKNNLRVDLVFAVGIVLVIILYGIGFWAYKDRPLINIGSSSQVSEELRGGWFSFENPLMVSLLLACSAISVLISSLIRIVRGDWLNEKKKNL